MGFFRQLKIFPRFLCVLLPFVSFAIIVTSIVLSSVNYNSFRNNLLRDYSDILRASAGEIHQYLRGSIKSLDGLASVLAVSRTDDYEREIALVAYQFSNPEFVGITLFSPKGEQLLSTRITGPAVEAAREEAFDKALLGKIGYSGARFTKESLPFACVAVPIQSRGRVVNVLWGELSLKSVWSVLDRIRLGETGKVYIVDLNGRFVSHPDMDKVVRGESIDPAIVARIAGAGDEPLPWHEDKDGRKSYCLGATISELNWLLVLIQDESETYAYLYEDIRWTAFVTLFICAMGPLVLWIPVKRLLEPIKAMHKKVLRIGQGELDLRIEVASNDEIGGLSSAFNKMADSLKGLIQREVELAKELLHAKNLATLGVAASKVTHEVGNLLTNISFIIMNLRSQELDSQSEKSVRLLEMESERVRAFIRNFLQFAKMPQLHFMKESFEVIIQQILAVYGREGELRGVRFEIEWDHNLPLVNMDVGLMHQVFTNLVKNSLDAISEAGVIRIEGSVEGEFLKIVIQDNGPGMPPDVREQVFNPFYTTKGRNGTGLGLSICKTIIDAHRGSIECMSEPGEFTAFILKLPLTWP